MIFLNRFRNFDVYTKPVDDCRVKTSFGGLIALTSFIVIGLLFISEIVSYYTVEVAEQLFVDSTSSEMKVDIHFDITFHKLPCDFVTVDVMGISGESQDAIEDDIFKQRLDMNGNNMDGADPEKQVINSKNSTSTEKPPESHEKKQECGSCYGASQGCCNTCDDVRAAYRFRGWDMDDLSAFEQCKDEDLVKKLASSRGQGCRVYGRVDVGKVGGNLHVAPGTPRTDHSSHYHDFKNMNPAIFDTSHTFNHFSFGKPFPGKIYPLDGKKFSTEKAGIMHQYYLKVVPTTYVFSITGSGREELSHQFSITRREKDISMGIGGVPGLFVIYEFSPLMVLYQEKKRSFTNFAVSLCAIIGGVFTVASLFDTFIYSGSRAMQKKFQIGKAN